MKENFSNFYFKLNDLLISILAETLKHKSIELFYKIEHRSIDFIRNQEKATYDMFINLEEIFSRTENSQLLQSVINFSQEDLILFFKLQELKNLLYPNEKIPEVLDLILFNLLKILKNQNVELYYNFKNWEKVYNKIEYYNIPESDYNLFFEENNINKNSLFFACWLKKKENEAIQKYKKIYSIHLTNFNNIKKLQFNDQKMLNFLLVEMHKIALEFRKKKNNNLIDRIHQEKKFKNKYKIVSEYFKLYYRFFELGNNDKLIISNSLNNYSEQQYLLSIYNGKFTKYEKNNLLQMKRLITEKQEEFILNQYNQSKKFKAQLKAINKEKNWYF